jgi:rifampin ADP-ribosylating transferase
VSRVRRERLRLSTGVELDVAQAGPQDGTPVLFLHGFTDSWFSFSPVLDRLSPGMRAIVPSQRGHGDSERPFCCYAISDLAADAVALLDALGIERAAVVGHSMGSIVAQRVAIDSPERVERLVLVGSGASPATKAVVALNEEVQGLADPISPDFVREFQVTMLSAPLPAAFLAGLIAESGKPPARVWRDALGGMLAGGAEEDLFRIAAPTLVVWGEDDPVFLREDQERLVSTIPGARLLVYEGTGHSPNWERPDRFAGDLREFLQPEGHVHRDRVRLSTGVELDVAQAGPPDGRPVLFLHGYTDSWFSYKPVLDRLPAGLRAIVPSQRGHGDSERPGCCYRVSDFAADAVALLDALGIERAAVVGHSMGSFVAQRVAIDWPDRVERLVLVGSGSSAATPAVVEFHGVVQALTDPIPTDFVREFQESTVAVPLPKPFLEGVVTESEKVPARVWRDALDGLLARDAGHEPSRIQAPTLVLSGEDDVQFPRAGQDALVKAIEGARLLVYERTAHVPHWERPDRFVDDLLAFLQPTAGGAR